MPKTPKRSPRPAIIMGDAHGEFNALAAALMHAELMDANLAWTGGKTILIQTGDILDRGPYPLQIDNLFDALQPQARKAGGDIVRLLGNHELEVLRKNYWVTSLPYYQLEPFRRKLMEGVLSGRWQAACAAHGFLVTHAGVGDQLYKELPPAKTAAAAAKELNKILKAAVMDGNYKHPIFNAGYLRGGPDRYGGIFWEDLTSLFESHCACPWRQIVGHTGVQHILMSADGKVIAVDVGMERVFAGQFEYLKIKSPRRVNIERVQ